jgi:hypothetical protein
MKQYMLSMLLVAGVGFGCSTPQGSMKKFWDPKVGQVNKDFVIETYGAPKNCIDTASNEVCTFNRRTTSHSLSTKESSKDHDSEFICYFDKQTKILKQWKFNY